jgi:hypothetical protein
MFRAKTAGIESSFLENFLRDIEGAARGNILGHDRRNITAIGLP